MEPCKENQDTLRRSGGILVLKNALVYNPLMSMSAEVLLMMVVDALWRSVIGNRKSEVRFIDSDGVDALLDLMENAPPSMHRQIIGCISDLVKNRRAKSYFRMEKLDLYAWSCRNFTRYVVCRRIKVENKERRKRYACESGCSFTRRLEANGFTANEPKSTGK